MSEAAPGESPRGSDFPYGTIGRHFEEVHRHLLHWGILKNVSKITLRADDVSNKLVELTVEFHL